MRRSRIQKIVGGRRKSHRGRLTYPIHSRAWCAVCHRENKPRRRELRWEADARDHHTGDRRGDA